MAGVDVCPLPQSYVDSSKAQSKKTISDANIVVVRFL